MAKDEPTYPAALGFSPRLRTLKSARTTFARILRKYADGGLDNDSARVWAYLFQVMLNVMKSEADYSVVDTIKELERRVKAIEKERNDGDTQTQRRIG